MASILITDDSRTSRKILRTLLEEGGHVIVGEAVTGEEAVVKYQELHPDITTMDITMPGLDGIEALRQIRALDAHAKVIMVTAAGQKGKILEAVKCGAADFISKPLEADRVLTVVAGVANQ